MIDDLTYEQTIELEKNIKIKNEANELYSNFKKYVYLEVSKFDRDKGMFVIWKDSNNGTYLEIINGIFTYKCRFLHESYDVRVTPSDLFRDIKNKYRGIDHFISMVNSFQEEHDHE